jgi:hypothetical protein
MEPKHQLAFDALQTAITETQGSPGAHAYDTFNQALMTAANAIGLRRTSRRPPRRRSS